jgi:hypothetical protein
VDKLRKQLNEKDRDLKESEKINRNKDQTIKILQEEKERYKTELHKLQDKFKKQEYKQNIFNPSHLQQHLGPNLNNHSNQRNQIISKAK